MNDLKTWLTYSFIFESSVTGFNLLERFGSPSAVLRQDPDALLSEDALTARMAEEMKKDHSRRVDFILAACLNFGWRILTPDSPEYPRAFVPLKDRPNVLYAAGDVSLLNAGRKVSVVGTRNPSKEALLAAYRLGEGLSRGGIVTVSGGAVGIDTAAHEGALLGEGSTVCVLGNGFGDNYLPARVLLRRRIAGAGVLITEMHPFAPTSARAFPKRNRMIAALSDAVCVMQSGLSGGSMSTAEHARRYGVPLFALSPEVFRSEGCETLLKKGAKPLSDLSDLLSVFGMQGSLPLKAAAGEPLPPSLRPETLDLPQFAFVNGVSPEEARPVWEHILRLSPALSNTRVLHPDPPAVSAEAPKKKKENPEKTAPVPAAEKAPDPAPDRERLAAGLDGTAKAVYLALEGTMTLDAVAAKTGLPAGDVLTAATMLELEGLCETLPGNRLKKMK